MHEATYHSCEVYRMTVLRWVHKLGYKWGDSSNAPFCDRHEHAEIAAYCNQWVKEMVALKPCLPTTGPHLPPGERPLMHGNHDECMLYANEGSCFAWVYHMNPRGDDATVMASGVSVACQWLDRT